MTRAASLAEEQKPCSNDKFLPIFSQDLSGSGSLAEEQEPCSCDVLFNFKLTELTKSFFWGQRTIAIFK